MNKLNFFFATASILLLLGSCVKDDCKRTLTYTKHIPIYKTYDEFRVDPVLESPRALKNPGKIYIQGSYLLINEIHEGVHIIDNLNPSAPNPIAFIAIPGNIDIALSGDILYADNYVDLLAIDIADINNIRLRKRVNDAFPSYGIDPDKGLLVAFDAKEVTEQLSCKDADLFSANSMVDMGTGAGPQTLADLSLGGGGVSAAVASNSRESMGIGGSMARFALNGQALYTVDQQDMHIYDITNKHNPIHINQITIGQGWGIETIFPYRDKLFIGSNIGMYIYDNSSPYNPVYLSEFQHAEACDPVFVEGDFAYITLRSGTRCQNWNNQMDIVDISDIQNPTLVSSTQLINPHGLSVENDIVYLCEGNNGLKILDASNKNNVSQLFFDDSKPAYDVISVPNANRLLMIGKDGFYQYNTSNPSSPQMLSHIPVTK